MRKKLIIIIAFLFIFIPLVRAIPEGTVIPRNDFFFTDALDCVNHNYLVAYSSAFTNVEGLCLTRGPDDNIYRVTCSAQANVAHMSYIPVNSGMCMPSVGVHDLYSLIGLIQEPDEICDNNKDDDFDGLVDLSDNDCEEQCTNGIDDDLDSLIDKADPDCVEICNNGIDDDEDHLIDLNDPDCYLENCNNGIDDDLNQLIDMDDPLCQAQCGRYTDAFNTNPSANSLSDGCCADDGLLDINHSITDSGTRYTCYDHNGLIWDVCGNGIISNAEDCDDGNQIDNDACNNACSLQADLGGWSTYDQGWREVGRVLVASSPDIQLRSTQFSIKANKEYVLKASVYNPNNACSVIIDMDDAKCISADTWAEQSDCFVNPSKEFLYAGAWQYASQSIRIAATRHNSSDGVFKDVRLRISVQCSGEMGVPISIDDVSLKEVSEAYHDDYTDIESSSACCPADYCWDGNKCVSAQSWMNDSQKAPLWSTFNTSKFINNHTMIADQYTARAYRCLLNDSGVADWRLSDIKYDWDFKESGYCNRPTDCFVSKTFPGAQDVKGLLNSYDNYNSSCIRDGQFVNDEYALQSGNHYCNQGTWTTKTFFIANVLENISRNKNYLLYCDDAAKVFNNAQNLEQVAGGCVLVTKGAKESVIGGFYLKEQGNFEIMCDLYDEWRISAFGLPGDCENEENLKRAPDACHTLDSGFKRCAWLTADNDNGLYVYYHPEYEYFIMSNKEITEIDAGLFNWNAIVEFFRKLFGYKPQQPLGLTNLTKDYERVYLIKNNTLHVYGIEEQKYDENLSTVMNFMYLNMSQPGMDSKNPLNVEFINDTVIAQYSENSRDANSQILIIKYQNSTRLWPYLTAMLRDR